MRKGDIVTIKARVIDPNENEFVQGKIYVEPFGHHASIYVSREATELLYQVFEKNERVRKKGGPAGIIVASFDDQYWVRFDNGHLGTIVAQDLEPWTQEEVPAHVAAA